MQAATWIVTANAGRARFFCETEGSDQLEEITDMNNSGARLKTNESMTDRLDPTAAHDSVHNTGGELPGKTYQPNQTPAQHETELFARDVADFLLESHQQGRYRDIALAASPQFLGVLRQQLDPQVRQLVCCEIDKDYTQSSPNQLRDQIHAHMKH